jgi:ubiquitin-protein ligase
MTTPRKNKIQRRLQNEVQDALDAGLIAELCVDTDSFFRETIYVAMVEVRGVGTVCVKYPPDYPFRPPKVRVNDMEYDRFLRLSSPRFRHLYDQMFSGRCSCACHASILSSEKWSPAYKLKDIVNDLCRLHHDKCFVAYSLQVESIKERHGLPEDVDILSFL